MAYKFVSFILVQLLITQIALATPQKVAFTSDYVLFYSSLKDTHALAKAALPYQKMNRNVPLSIKTLQSLPAQKLPKLTLRGRDLVFQSSGTTTTLVPMGGTRFLLDGQRIDLKDDLSKYFTKNTPWPLLIEEAHAIGPFIWALIVAFSVAGAGACFNSTVNKYLSHVKDEIQAKWVSAPGTLNSYFREAKNLVRPICPGAAWADDTMAFDYELFFDNYCSRVRAQSTLPVQTHTFDENLATNFYGGSDEVDRTIIKVAMEQDPEFILECINKPRLINQAPTTPVESPTPRAQ